MLSETAMARGMIKVVKAVESELESVNIEITASWKTHVDIKLPMKPPIDP
jgi:hypothetical protein